MYYTVIVHGLNITRQNQYATDMGQAFNALVCVGWSMGQAKCVQSSFHMVTMTLDEKVVILLPLKLLLSLAINITTVWYC